MHANLMHCRAGCRSQTLSGRVKRSLETGLQAVSLSPYCTGLAALHPQRQGCPPLYEHAIVLVAFRFQVSSLTFGTSLEVPPG